MKKVINFVSLAAIMTVGMVTSTQANTLDELIKRSKS